jgi:hypothetical protein
VNTIGPGGLIQNLLVLPTLAVAAGFSAYLLSAAVGTGLGTLSRGNESMRMVIQMFPLVLIFILIPSMNILAAEVVGPDMRLLIPGLGAVFAALGLADGLHLVWIAAALAIQVVWGLLGLRIATWLFALEEDPLADLRRRLPSIRGRA